MRAAVVYYAEKRKGELEELSRGLARGLEKQNFSVDIFNAKDFSRRLAIYQVVAIVTESVGNFGGKVPAGLAKYLESTGPSINLRSLAYIAKKGMRTQKSLQALMKTMESEGMLVLSSGVLENMKAAEDAGARLIVK